MSSSPPLLDYYALKLYEEESIPKSLPRDPISRYNLVIDAYNHECNRINDNFLTKSKDSSLYRCSYSLMNSFFGEVLLIVILIFVPGINVLTFFLILWSFVHYSRFVEICKENEKVLQDPFKNMVYSPEMCETLNRIHWFFELEFKDLQGLTLNLDTIDFLRSRNKNGKVSFMIYNNIFWNFYHDVNPKRNFHLMWLLFSLFLLFLSGSVIYMYYYLLKN